MTFKFFVFTVLVFFSLHANGDAEAGETKLIRALSSLPDIAWLMSQVGGEHIEVEALLGSQTNPHFAQARSSYSAKVATAELLCFVGMGLEDAWLDRVIEVAANPRIRKGQPGYCEVSAAFDESNRLGVLTKDQATRDKGHVHAQGNPHFWLSPTRMATVAVWMAEHLSKLRPEHSDDFSERAADLVLSLNSLHEQAAVIMGQLRLRENLVILQYHEDFDYWLHDLGWDTPKSLEPLPGEAPSNADLARLVRSLKSASKEQAIVLHASWDPRSRLQAFSQSMGPKATSLVEMPALIEGDYLKAEAYAQRYEKFISVLEGAVDKKIEGNILP